MTEAAAFKKSRFQVCASWDDAPHLTPEVKAEMLAVIPEYLRDARTKGLPYLGAGAIYPVPIDDILVDDFEIPKHWPCGFGLDVGWQRTAAIWAALDRQSDVAYFWSEHYMGQVDPAIHAQAILARGAWIPGDIDPSANGERNLKDGEQLTETYRKLGLKLQLADNTVEAGIYEMWIRLSHGKLKVFRSLKYFQQEYRLYRRDEHGKIVKRNDHVLDAARYSLRHMYQRWRTKDYAEYKAAEPFWFSNDRSPTSWMGS